MKPETLRLRLSYATGCLLFACLLGVFFAIPTHAMTKAETNVSKAKTGCTFARVEGTYSGEMAGVVERINQIRKEACDAGEIDPRDWSRILTSKDYVSVQANGLTEKAAQIRYP